MEALKIIFTGIIDGLTGFLPVSSSGHLAVLRNVLGIVADSSVLFDIFLKTAALVVIVIAFKKDVIGLLKAARDLLRIAVVNIFITFSNIGKEKKEAYYPAASTSYRKLALMILLALIPTGFIGYIGRDFASVAAGTVFFPGICIVATGVMLYMTEGIPQCNIVPLEASWFSAFVIGAVQGISVLPGLSRCGLVIAACLLFGYDKKLTFKFTFLSAIPALVGAIAVDVAELVDEGAADVNNIGFYIIAAVMAVITGYIGLSIVNKTIKKGKFKPFSIYCLVVGGITLASMILM